MPQDDSLIGRQLGNLRIERLLGRGGMASVYYGVDLTLRRPVAIKVIDERHRGDPGYAERFLREAQAMAAWRHPNIPNIYQAGEEQGLYFYAMEYVPGLDLERLLRRYSQVGELPPQEDVLRIGQAVADALDYAHKQGAIHRDVKPSNVLIAGDGRILLTDFGLVMLVAEGTIGEVFGSPQYISPEQARSSAGATPRSDLYSLGVMLYEMLTGSLPFDDPSPAALAVKHITEEPPPPSSINPDLSPEVEAVLLKALQKNPEQRYRSGRELMSVLRRALKTEKTEPRQENVSASPQVTLPVLPGSETPATRPTVSRLHIDDIVAATIGLTPAETPPTRAFSDSIPHKGHISAGLLAGRWGWGCTFALLLTLFLLGLVGIFALGRSIWARAGSAIEPSPTDQVIASFPTLTSTRKVSPSSSPTSKPTRTPNRTPTPKPSHTPTPSRTATPEPDFHLLLAMQRDESLFVVNLSKADFPLPELQLGTGSGRVQGEEWKVDRLKDGECVAIWKKEGKPSSPRGLECDLVGQRLERSNKERFWESNFYVYFQGERLDTCEVRKEFCEFEFSLAPQ